MVLSILSAALLHSFTTRLPKFFVFLFTTTLPSTVTHFRTSGSSPTYLPFCTLGTYESLGTYLICATYSASSLDKLSFDIFFFLRYLPRRSCTPHSYVAILNITVPSYREVAKTLHIFIFPYLTLVKLSFPGKQSPIFCTFIGAL
ncbi:hypothetical protein K445DRAFT_142553 [Daldinia sp. EC12]|nr:hypothetical protein K445DRAFT_142553 [Daldinia sp. EC12]